MKKPYPLPTREALTALEGKTIKAVNVSTPAEQDFLLEFIFEDGSELTVLTYDGAGKWMTLTPKM